MGGQNYYKAEGGFSQYLYHQVGDIISANGVSAKVVEKINPNDNNQGLPRYSNSSDMYLAMGGKSGEIIQARVYVGRKAYMDIDWGHSHRGTPQGIAHVHFYALNDKGEPVKTGRYRLLNNKEMKKYGLLLKKANPKVKFR